MNKRIALTLLSSAVLSSMLLSGCSDDKKAENKPENPTVNQQVEQKADLVNTPENFTTSYNSINKEQLVEHIKVLASDEFEGRAPSSKGEKLTLDYLTKQLTAVGFKPLNNKEQQFVI